MRIPRRRIYGAITVFGLALYLVGFLGQTRLAALPNDFDPRALDFPVEMVGSAGENAEEASWRSSRSRSVNKPAELTWLAESLESGRTIQLLDAGGRTVRVALPRAHSWDYLTVVLLSGLCFWGVAAFVFAPRVEQASVPIFFWATFLYGLAVMIGGVYPFKDPIWLTAAFDVIQITCLSILPVLLVQLSLCFPRRDPFLSRRRWFMPSLWILAGVLIVWQSIAFFRYFLAPTPGHHAAIRLPGTVGDMAMVAQASAGFLILFVRSRSLELTRERKQLKWLLFGFVVGVAPYVFFRVFLGLLNIDPPHGPQFDRIFELAIPLAFVAAVVFFRFLDIDIVLRRSLIYATIAFGFIIVYVGLGILVTQRVEPATPHWLWLWIITLGVIAGITFRPLRDQIGRRVDRIFFKITHDYDRALGSLEKRLDKVTSQEELADLLYRFLRLTVHPRRHAVILREADGWRVVGATTPEEEGRLVGMEADILRIDETLARPGSTSLPEVESERFPAHLIREELVLLQPIGTVTSGGALLLGIKDTERRYIEPDVELIRGAAGAAAGVLERIRLVQTVAEEAMRSRQLHELNRLKTDFLSRVAHDLKNPLTTISYSTENLLDGVAGPVVDAQKEYLGSIKVSVAHLNRMVANLLEISRLESPDASLDLGPVDLRSVLEQTTLMIRPLAEEKKVALRLIVSDKSEPVRGNESKLIEVALNLIDNAIKFSPPGAEVEIRAGDPGDGWQEFSVRDHGPGFDPDMAEKLFLRFRQAEESPHSKTHGFGLGLFIVKSYLDQMGGSVEAGNHPDGGAVFTCGLPSASRKGMEP